MERRDIMETIDMSEKKLKVLFVGNSYTFYYYMPETLFVEAAAAQGYEVEVTEVTCGGAFLSQFADPEHSEGISRFCPNLTTRPGR